MNRKLNWLWSGRILFVLGLAIIPACAPEPDPVGQEISESIPQQVVAGMTLRESQAGRLRWVLQADSALHYGEGEATVLLGVQVSFYNDSGDSVRSWLTARQGQIDPHSRDLVARDSVVVRTREGDCLETEELRYEKRTGNVVSDCFVRLTRGASIVTGIGIETDASLKSYVIRSRVEGDLHEADGVPLSGPR